MTSEDPKIAGRDWRLQAITTTTADATLPDGTSHPAGTVVELAGFLQLDGETIGIPVPNAVALYIALAKSAGEQGESARTTLAELPAASAHSYRRLMGDDEARFFDSLQSLVAGVFFGYTALEAFANASLPDDFLFRRSRADGRCTEEFSRDQVERNVHLRDKLDVLLPEIFSVASPKGTGVWDRFVRLQRLRDRFVHLKAKDWRKVNYDDAPSTIWTELLAPDVPRIYRTSLDIIQHFAGASPPRWLWKLQEELGDDSA